MAEEAAKAARNLKPLLALIIAAAAFATFSASLSGEFVYDDTRQIVRNTLIQEPSLYWKALTSDVWAFMADGSITASNYWRPTFTAWSILNYQLFGLDPSGWHIGSLLLHSTVSCLAFILMLRLGISRWGSFAGALLFAVHPVHTESVAWVAGTPDLLFATFLLGSLLAFDSHVRSPNRFAFGGSLVLFSAALGSKEVAMLCFPVFGALFVLSGGIVDRKIVAKRAVFAAAPFAILATLFFLLRWTVLGSVTRELNGSPDFATALLSAPSVAVFYLRQMVFPFFLAANHPVRPVEEAGILSFVVPLLISLAVLIGLWQVARRSRWGIFGLLLLLLPLLPVFNITTFLPDQMVHDRYLYLPLLGFLILLIPFAESLLGRISDRDSGPILAVLAGLVALPLAAQSFSYSRAWKNEMALWEWNVKADPESMSSFVQYGAALESEERYSEAVAAYDRSLEAGPNVLAFLGRARSNVRLGNFGEAILDLERITSLPADQVNAYSLYQAYEALAIALTASGRSEEAIEALEEAGTRLPIYRAALTAKLAVVYYQQGKKERALEVLESVRERAKSELLPESKSAIYRLGALYAEMGRREEAAAALNEYLRLTASFADENTLADRKRAEELLASLR